jgi:hypothetical protein
MPDVGDCCGVPRSATLPDMNAPVPGPRRVRVVLGGVSRQRRAEQTRDELAQQSQVGEALLRGLVRSQLSLALRLAAVVGVGLGGLPLLFAVAPPLARVRPIGVALPWLLLGVLAYPFLFAVGAAYVRLAERTERDFTELVERPVEPGPPR